MIKTIKPARLKQGDTIGLIAPASSITKEQYDTAVRNLENLGFKVKEGRYLREQHGYLGGKDELRIDDLHAMFLDEEVQGIWAVRGGYGCTRILPHLDYDLIRQHPKVLIGYSDTTALSQAIYQKTGLVSFHGPVAVSDFTAYTVKCLKRVLIEPELPQVFERFEGMDEQEDYIPYNISQGVLEGRLAGGNLSLLAAMSGTEFQLQPQGKLIFIEDIGEKPYRIDRMLTQLQQSGQLDDCKGVLLGIFENCLSGPKSHFFPIKETLNDRLGNLNVPVAYGFSFGHISNMCTLPIGIQARYNPSIQKLTLLEPSVV